MKSLSGIMSVLLAAALCFTLCACGVPGNVDPDDEKNQSTQGSTAPTETTPAATEETPTATEETDPEVSVKEPLDIETVGGVVIVGRIGYDAGGWHIVPEQPLNITYEYFLDNPSVFPEQTRISIADPELDGIDKSVYLGQTVTLRGEFRFVRNDFDTLYLFPYTITMGKIVEESYGDPELKAPDGFVDLYDRSKPLPEQMESRITDGKYSYNPYMLSLESLQLMGNDFALFYCDFIDAILNYRSEVSCPQKSYAEMLGSVIYYDCPIFDACAQPFEFFKHYDSETNTVSIDYKYGAEEHQKLIAQFQQAADAMLAAAAPDMGDVEKAKNIYHALCTRMDYDDSALEDWERKDSYYAYLHNSGVCITFANVYNQLLTQVGIQTTLATCEYDATMGHAWSVVTLEGEDYFCDPTFELSYDNGSGYLYFGMNYANRISGGTGAGGIRMGKYFTYAVQPEMIAEHSLDQS